MLRVTAQRLAALASTARSELRVAREHMEQAQARAEYLRTVMIPRRARIVSLIQLSYNAMQMGVFQLLQAKQNEAGARRSLIGAIRDYWIAATEMDVARAGVGRYSVRPERTIPKPEHADLFRMPNQQETKTNE